MIKYTQTILPKPERTRKMKITKKGFKRGISAFLAAVTLSTSLTINSSATALLSKSVDYDYYGAAFLTLSPTADNSTIRYTTDGSAPTINSTKYSGELYFSSKTTVRAAEFDVNGKKISTIKTTVSPKCSSVKFDIDYQIGKSVVSLVCDTYGAQIHYTTDGSKPTESSPIYSEPITLKEKTKIRAVAILDGFKNSATVSKTVKIGNYIESDNAPDEDDSSTSKIKYKTTYMAEKGYMYVTLMPQKSSNVIYYTPDGSKPDKNSKKYSKRIKLTDSTTVRAAEYTKKGEKVASSIINVKMKCAPVEFDCIDIATGTKTITLSTITEGATIYYTIDGTTPDPEYSDVYTEPLTLGDKSTIKAIVVKNGWKQSSTKAETVSEIPLHLTDFNFGNPIYSETAVVLNSYRRANGLSSLILDEKLTEAANIRAKELSVYMDHTRPTGTGYLTAVEDCGVKVRFAAEFIASYYKTPSEFASATFADKTNYNSLLGNGYNYNSIGVGYYEKGKNRYWVVIIAETVDN